MTVILFLLIVSLTLGALGLVVFLWSLRSGQYDDLDEPVYSADLWFNGAHFLTMSIPYQVAYSEVRQK